MTDQATTDDDRRLAREWAEFIESRPDSWTERISAAARVILSDIPAPTLPTLADMTPEERDACQWMQADVKGDDTRVVIVNPFWKVARARVMWPDTCMGEEPWENITPRPDLPRMEWPGDTPAPAPALPDGWRLADHPVHGRVVVTNPIPTSDGRVYYAMPAPGILGRDGSSCAHGKLTYLDQ